MVKVFAAFALFVCSIASAQGKFEEGMAKAFQLWGEGENTEASAMFERIASAEKGSWLPNYYVAMVNITAAFTEKDKIKISALLTKAQDVLDFEMARDDKNSELLVMQALLYTAYVASDPMTNGMKYSSKIIELYTRAQVISPENPRAVFGKAEYEIGGARYFGSDTKEMCAEIDRSIALFANFKPATAFHPKWGEDRALAAQKECKK